MEWHNKEFLISDDIKNILLCEVVCLHTEVNGLDGYSEEKFRRLLDTSFWLGLYKEKKLIGFVRAVTDKETLCYICDIIIDTKFQRQGLGSWMMNCFLMHPDVCQTSMGLGTQDADYFFRKFDFERCSTMRRLSRPE